MTIRAPRYLYIREAFPITIDGLGTGKTVTAKLCESRVGVPSAIGTLTLTLSEDGSTGNYSGTFARADLLSELGTDWVGKRIHLHFDDGAVWHDVWPMQVTDEDPDLLPTLAA